MNHLEKNPLVAVILVNWNSYPDTFACIDSIKSSSYKNLSIIVVDNGSIDGSVEKLQSNQNNYKLILSPENTGFTGGNNIGIKYAQSINADYIFLLNNDTLIDNECITRLVSTSQSRPQIGITTPKIFFYPETTLIWSAGTSFDWGLLMGLNLGYKKQDSKIYDLPAKLEYAVGCALLIKKSVIDSLGMLTEDYFATWEDVDFGLRARKHGYEVIYEPTAIVWHKESSSAGGTNNPQYVYYQTRSALVFKARWAKSRSSLIKGYLHYSAYCILRICKLIPALNFRAIFAIFLAYLDAISGNLGRKDYKILNVKRDISR